MPLVVIDAHYRLKSQKETSFISEFHQKETAASGQTQFLSINGMKNGD